MKILLIVTFLSLIVISKSSTVASSICERCDTFSDGCNTCTCTDEGLFACTRRLCLNGTIEEPGCRICKDGYELNADTYACESTVCGGVDNCLTYFDGCNDCTGCENENGILACTDKYCDTYGDAYCKTCIDGYELNEDRTACIQPCAFDNCVSFNDGCNICLCTDGEASACTKKLCFEEGTPECLRCETGYELNNGTCEETTENCGGIENCDEYFDGCNTCTGCQSADGPACTEMACQPDAYEEAYCKSCIDGYELINGYCAEQCLGFENCASYTDGCNTCQCVDGETLGCTKLFCFWEGIPACLDCNDGYYLVNGTCEEIPTCGGFDFCTAYNKDCNDCTCGDSPTEACTDQLCDADNPIENACSSCVDGYVINDETNQCSPEGSSYCGENCIRYSDGCNACQCENEYTTATCTDHQCFWEGIPGCEACADGYEVVNGTCQEYIPDTTCSDNCARWYDGCNWCSCTDGSIAACTLRLCYDYEESYCLECNEGYEFNRYGECVESSSVSCGGFDNCVNYFDGCNWCGCSHGNVTWCTLRFCPDGYYEDRYCTKCEDGYNVTASGECGKVCGGFDNCIEYYDGCNSCFCGDDGMVGCTEMFCQKYDDPYCTTCEDGYELNANNECIEVDMSSTEEPIYCGEFKNCLAYNDGCNDCTCDGACTDMECDPWGEPECTECVDGYTLYNGECIDPTDTCAYDCSSWFDGCNYCFCEDGVVGGCTRMYCENYADPYCRDNITTTDATTEPPTECEQNGGYGCITYFDGCNNCTCVEYGVECGQNVCTSLGEYSCVECEDRMILENGECMVIETTEEPSDPSDANMFRTMVGIGFVFSLLSWM